MADDEQFSLCWNNFNSNLSAGFHESLCRGDLVDVTLAAEGQFVKAHRLVLSVCSPYFRKMFTQMPANQHAFVFLKDVTHTALKDLIQFMYCGEVNVKQEALPAFISTAEALQIKGLTDGDPAQSQSPVETSTSTSQQIQQISSPRIRQRSTNTRSYKIESVDDSILDKPNTQIVIQTQSTSQHPTTQTTATASSGTGLKRPAQRSLATSTSHIKRTKSTTINTSTSIDPLENTDNLPVPRSATTSQTPSVSGDKQGQQQSDVDTEYIDLPIELPTKSEPDYADDSADVESGDNDGTYDEDVSYGDLRYDESYFDENEESATTTNTSANASGTPATTSKVIVKQQTFSDSSYIDGGDQSNTDAQALYTEMVNQCRVKYRKSLKGCLQLVVDEYPYTRHRVRGNTTYWRCVQFKPLRCGARVRTNPSGDLVSIVDESHNHDILKERRKKGSLKKMMT